MEWVEQLRSRLEAGDLYLTLQVSPGRAVTKVKERKQVTEEDTTYELWTVDVAAPPEKGKANKELLSFFRKHLGKQYEYVMLLGAQGRRKILKISKL